MTTEIKSRLSELGKQLKKKLTVKQTAEEAELASPAEAVAQEEQGPAAENEVRAEASQEIAETLEAPESRKAPETDAGDRAASGGAEASEEPPTAEEEAESSRISDEALAAVLLAYGWHVPGGRGEGTLDSPETTQTAPALEELAAEVSAAMGRYSEENVSVYEDEPSFGGTQEEPSAPVSDATAVFDTIGEAPIGAEEGRPSEELPGPVQEQEAEETPPIDAGTLLSGMNQDILKEVFSEEELHALTGDDTHVFKKEELDDLSEKQKEEEEKKKEKEVQDSPEQEEQAGRRRKRIPEPEKPAKKRMETSPEEQEYTPRDYRPIRRKRSYRTGLRGGLMYFGFVICVSVILASVGWLAADDVLALNKDYVEAEVYVGEDLDMKQVSAELYNKGLIKYRKLFQIFAKLMKAENKIEPGVYTLSSKLDYNAMVHAMHQNHSTFEERATVKVTIPEGKTLKQTFQILAEHGVCPYETLLECSAGYEFKYDFLEDLPYGSETRLEGYLFPDTYEFFAPSDPEEAIEKFLDNFKSKVTAEMRAQAAEHGYTLHQIVTVASLVEMEAGKDTERATIASVIYNRLSSSYYPYLQIDATIQYALEERKESLTYEDLEIDSPYNTYKYTGLPPGPIANPGLASIRAALTPEDTGYYFYALNKSGSHNFFATQSQFEYFVNSSEFGG